MIEIPGFEWEVIMELVVKDLSKSFASKKVVNEINYTFENGVYGLLGANGAGKTTFMKMLSGLLQPSTGSILINKINKNTMGEMYYDLIGYLPQEYGYYPEFTAINYLKYIATIKGINKNEIQKRVNEVLSIVSLESNKNVKIKTFSGGMKRRLGIAQAIINNPKILILDEPTAGLDPKERNKFRNLLSELSENRIILLSTHIVSDIESIARNILIMKEGNIISKGSVEELLIAINNFVWKVNLPYNEADQVVKEYLVSNQKNYSDYIELRIISEYPPHYSAVRIDPTLEDLFIFYFNEEVKKDES